MLRGFGIGEEGVEDVLVASQLVAPTFDSGQKDGCIGCHSVIRTLRGIPAYSRGHWADGDHIVLLMDGQNQGKLLGRLPDPAHRHRHQLTRLAGG